MLANEGIDMGRRKLVDVNSRDAVPSHRAARATQCFANAVRPLAPIGALTPIAT